MTIDEFLLWAMYWCQAYIKYLFKYLFNPLEVHVIILYLEKLSNGEAE